MGLTIAGQPRHQRVHNTSCHFLRTTNASPPLWLRRKIEYQMMLQKLIISPRDQDDNLIRFHISSSRQSKQVRVDGSQTSSGSSESSSLSQDSLNQINSINDLWVEGTNSEHNSKKIRTSKGKLSSFDKAPQTIQEGCNLSNYPNRKGRCKIMDKGSVDFNGRIRSRFDPKNRRWPSRTAAKNNIIRYRKSRFKYPESWSPGSNSSDSTSSLEDSSNSDPDIDIGIKEDCIMQVSWGTDDDPFISSLCSSETHITHMEQNKDNDMKLDKVCKSVPSESAHADISRSEHIKSNLINLDVSKFLQCLPQKRPHVSEGIIKNEDKKQTQYLETPSPPHKFLRLNDNSEPAICSSNGTLVQHYPQIVRLTKKIDKRSDSECKPASSKRKVLERLCKRDMISHSKSSGEHQTNHTYKKPDPMANTSQICPRSPKRKPFRPIGSVNSIKHPAINNTSSLVSDSSHGDKKALLFDRISKTSGHVNVADEKENLSNIQRKDDNSISEKKNDTLSARKERREKHGSQFQKGMGAIRHTVVHFPHQCAMTGKGTYRLVPLPDFLLPGNIEQPKSMTAAPKDVTQPHNTTKPQNITTAQNITMSPKNKVPTTLTEHLHSTCTTDTKASQKKLGVETHYPKNQKHDILGLDDINMDMDVSSLPYSTPTKRSLYLKHSNNSYRLRKMKCKKPLINIQQSSSRRKHRLESTSDSKPTRCWSNCFLSPTSVSPILKNEINRTIGHIFLTDLSDITRENSPDLESHLTDTARNERSVNRSGISIGDSIESVKGSSEPRSVPPLSALKDHEEGEGDVIKPAADDISLNGDNKHSTESTWAKSNTQLTYTLKNKLNKQPSTSKEKQNHKKTVANALTRENTSIGQSTRKALNSSLNTPGVDKNRRRMHNQKRVRNTEKVERKTILSRQYDSKEKPNLSFTASLKLKKLARLNHQEKTIPHKKETNGISTTKDAAGIRTKGSSSLDYLLPNETQNVNSKLVPNPIQNLVQNYVQNPVKDNKVLDMSKSKSSSKIVKLSSKLPRCFTNLCKVKPKIQSFRNQTERNRSIQSNKTNKVIKSPERREDRDHSMDVSVKSPPDTQNSREISLLHFLVDASIRKATLQGTDESDNEQANDHCQKKKLQFLMDQLDTNKSKPYSISTTKEAGCYQATLSEIQSKSPISDTVESYGTGSYNDVTDNLKRLRTGLGNLLDKVKKSCNVNNSDILNETSNSSKFVQSTQRIITEVEEVFNRSVAESETYAEEDDIISEFESYGQTNCQLQKQVAKIDNQLESVSKNVSSILPISPKQPGVHKRPIVEFPVEQDAVEIHETIDFMSFDGNMPICLGSSNKAHTLNIEKNQETPIENKIGGGRKTAQMHPQVERFKNIYSSFDTGLENVQPTIEIMDSALSPTEAMRQVADKSERSSNCEKTEISSVVVCFNEINTSLPSVPKKQECETKSEIEATGDCLPAATKSVGDKQISVVYDGLREENNVSKLSISNESAGEATHVKYLQKSISCNTSAHSHKNRPVGLTMRFNSVVYGNARKFQSPVKRRSFPRASTFHRRSNLQYIRYAKRILRGIKGVKVLTESKQLKSSLPVSDTTQVSSPPLINVEYKLDNATTVQNPMDSKMKTCHDEEFGVKENIAHTLNIADQDVSTKDNPINILDFEEKLHVINEKSGELGADCIGVKLNISEVIGSKHQNICEMQQSKDKSSDANLSKSYLLNDEDTNAPPKSNESVKEDVLIVDPHHEVRKCEQIEDTTKNTTNSKNEVNVEDNRTKPVQTSGIGLEPNVSQKVLYAKEISNSPDDSLQLTEILTVHDTDNLPKSCDLSEPDESLDRLQSASPKQAVNCEDNTDSCKTGGIEEADLESLLQLQIDNTMENLNHTCLIDFFKLLKVARRGNGKEQPSDNFERANKRGKHHSNLLSLYHSGPTKSGKSVNLSHSSGNGATCNSYLELQGEISRSTDSVRMSTVSISAESPSRSKRIRPQFSQKLSYKDFAASAKTLSPPNCRSIEGKEQSIAKESPKHLIKKEVEEALVSSFNKFLTEYEAKRPSDYETKMKSTRSYRHWYDSDKLIIDIESEQLMNDGNASSTIRDLHSISSDSKNIGGALSWAVITNREDEADRVDCADTREPEKLDEGEKGPIIFDIIESDPTTKGLGLATASRVEIANSDTVSMHSSIVTLSWAGSGDIVEDVGQSPDVDNNENNAALQMPSNGDDSILNSSPTQFNADMKDNLDDEASQKTTTVTSLNSMTNSSYHSDDRHTSGRGKNGFSKTLITDNIYHYLLWDDDDQ